MEKLFLYNESKVRTEIDANGDYWFAGVDLCNILEYANSTQVIEKLDNDERKLDYLTDSSGQKRKTWIVNESGMYSLVLSSEKPEAKVFKRWLTHDVLPELRKAGIYSTDSLNRKNIMIQDIMKKIESKNTEITTSKTTTKRLEKESAKMQSELILLLKSNPNHTAAKDSLQKEIEKPIKEEE